ncbi:MAG: hypothetical protein LBI56_00185 [Puniceicoccales bacterium]|jgi:hypothetical protein|nr:hypothetical protein [Puniceicoccales bacterium]
MKKLSIILAGLLGVACLGAAGEAPSWQSDISTAATVKFESKHLRRGQAQMKETFVADICLGYKGFSDIELYVGVDGAFNLHRQKINLADMGRAVTVMYHAIEGTAIPGINPPAIPTMAQGVAAIYKVSDNFDPMHNHISPYLGITYDINDTFGVEAGYTHHSYTNVNSLLSDVLGVKKGSNEVYVGVYADVLLSPSLYCFYNFDYKEVALEGKANYYFDLSEQVLSGLGIDLGAKLGYDRTSKPYGSSIFERGDHKGYCYYGANVDLVCALNEHAKAKIGAAVEGNSAKKDAVINIFSINDKKTQIWFNASVDCAF